MNTLGIYLGPKFISLVETQGKKVINSIQIPQETIVASDLEERVPLDIKMVALFKDELRKNQISAKQANIALSGKDLIIRTFEMPVLPRDEVDSAINFEAKKYLPFKIEELVLAHQVFFDKSINKNMVLLVGIKKETMDSYFSVFSQLDLEIASIEYAGFSVLRLLRLAGFNAQGVKAVISADTQGEDEVNVNILEGGFPLFSRDIILSNVPQEGTIAGKETGMFLEKLKTEIRISLDYYHRKFPAKNIEKIFLIGSSQVQADLEVFIKEMGLVTQFIDVSSFIVPANASSLNFAKGYSISLSRAIKTGLKLDLLAARAEALAMKEPHAKLEFGYFLAGLKINPKIATLALLICVATFAYGLVSTLSLNKELQQIISRRPKVVSVNPEAGYEELLSVDSAYKTKLDTLNSLIKQKLCLTSPLNVIPRIIPEGIWLTNFSFHKEDNQTELDLEGMAYLGDPSKEFDLVNSFLLKLRENPVFANYFKEINIVSVDTAQVEKTRATSFKISCRESTKQ